MRTSSVLFFAIMLMQSGCKSDKQKTANSRLFAKVNLVALCLVPFDSLERTPDERASMLSELGFKQFAYDWRLKHLPTFPEEIKSLKAHGINLTAVWLWIDTDSTAIFDATTEQL